MAVVDSTTSYDDVYCFLSSRNPGDVRKPISAGDIAKKIDAEPESVRYCLDDLLAEEKIERTDAGVITVLTQWRCSPDLRCASHSRTAQSREPQAEVLGRRKPAVPVYSSHPADVKDLTGFDLAIRFRGVLEKAAARQNLLLGPNPFNHWALAGSFARWRKEGFDSITIAAMIDCFADDLARQLRPGKPPWRLFLAARTGLYNKVSTAVRNATLTDDDWSGASSTEQKDHDWDHWAGRTTT